MAVADVLEQTKAPLLDRKAELQSAFDEYNEIVEVLTRLDGGEPPRSDAASSASPPLRRATAPASPRSRRKAATAPRGGRRQQVHDLVRERPGITIPEMAQTLGIKDNYLYRVTGDLTESKALRKEGRGFHVVE